jgi:hypothetical protein
MPISALSRSNARQLTLREKPAGLIWGLFNFGFATIFSLGPSLLVERGWSIAAAGSTISIVLWLALVPKPA